MSTERNGVKRYFDRVPREWEALYSYDNKLKYYFNRLVRKGLFFRYNATFESCGDISGARVLDIGCGTGQFSIEFAKRGAKKVVGIDFAPAMVSFSQQKAKEMGVAEKCEFVCADFLTYPLEESFDIVVALGFFDYISDAGPLFRKIATLTRGSFLASFPKDSLIWGTQRKIRYLLIRKCPIFSYTEDQLNKLYQQAKFDRYKIISINKGFFGIAKNS